MAKMLTVSVAAIIEEHESDSMNENLYITFTYIAPSCPSAYISAHEIATAIMVPPMAYIMMVPMFEKNWLC